MADETFDALLQRGGRRGAARAGALHGKIHHPLAKAAKGDIAAIIGHGGANARFQQVENLRDDILVLCRVAPVAFGILGPAVTVTKSRPKNTPVTSPSENSASARGEAAASSSLVNSRVAAGITSRPGKNLRVAGLGVVSVSINMMKACRPRRRQIKGQQSIAQQILGSVLFTSP